MLLKTITTAKSGQNEPKPIQPAQQIGQSCQKETLDKHEKLKKNKKYANFPTT